MICFAKYCPTENYLIYVFPEKYGGLVSESAACIFFSSEPRSHDSAFALSSSTSLTSVIRPSFAQLH